MSNERITDERLAEVLTEAYGSPEWTMADVRAARAVESASIALRPAAQPDSAPAAERAESVGVPDIDYEALIHAAFAKNKKWAQGTAGCVAFARGAEWYRDICLTHAQPAREPTNGVPVPTTEDQAAAMQMLGQAWLEQHAPHRLKAAQPVGEPVASIYISPSGQREFDDWKCDLPAGRNILYTTPQPVPERVPVAISDHEKDCATCAHQTLPPYMPKCQQCNRLATGARRNWQAQPVFERVPMSRKDLKAFMDESGYGHVTAQEKADFINGFRSAEAHHRITTPSNQPARTE